MEVFEKMLVGQQLKDIFDDFGSFWQSLVSEDQIRWVCVFNFWEARFHDKLEIYAVHHVIIIYSITQQEILIYLFFQLGPEKGVIHLATAAIVNALWDLWAKIENKVVFYSNYCFSYVSF